MVELLMQEKRTTSADEQQNHAARRLSAFFGSTPGQDPKTAKYAVLTPGPGMFVNVQFVSRVMIPPPIRNSPCFGV